MENQARYSVDIGSNIRPDPAGMTAEEAGDELITWFTNSAAAHGDPFDEWERWALRATLADIMNQPIEAAPKMDRLMPHAVRVIRQGSRVAEGTRPRRVGAVVSVAAGDTDHDQRATVG